MNRDPDERAQPEDEQVPDEFDAIVAGWRSEGQVPAWPADDTVQDEPPAEDPPVDDPLGGGPPGAPLGGVPPGAGPGSAGPARGGRGAGALFGPTPVPPPADEDHYVPPEPPPLPRLGPPAMVGLALLTLGIVLVVAPGWVGVPVPYGLPLGLVALASGLGWLVLRLWPDSPDDAYGDGEDDGAIL